MVSLILLICGLGHSHISLLGLLELTRTIAVMMFVSISDTACSACSNATDQNPKGEHKRGRGRGYTREADSKKKGTDTRTEYYKQNREGRTKEGQLGRENPFRSTKRARMAMRQAYTYIYMCMRREMFGWISVYWVLHHCEFSFL